jgi:hypothetical protein
MNKTEIITAIENRRGSTSYTSWTIGVTDDPSTRKAQHESEGSNVSCWTQWITGSEKEGREVEKYFLDKGMKGGTGGGGYAGYVYIF